MLINFKVCNAITNRFGWTSVFACWLGNGRAQSAGRYQGGRQTHVADGYAGNVIVDSNSVFSFMFWKAVRLINVAHVSLMGLDRFKTLVLVEHFCNTKS